jgi:hypothetical protein
MMNEAIEAVEGLGELDPFLRASGEPKGIPIEIDGKTWLLAHGGAAHLLDHYRDRMDDQVRLTGQVDMTDVWEVGRLMLVSNYELTETEVVELLAGADRKAIVDGVMAAMFGRPNPHRTFTMWMISSLHANGLDPATIPPEMLPLVLDQLVTLGRAVPIEKYTDAAIAAPRLAKIRAMATERAAKAEAEPPSPALPEPPQ